MQYKYMYIAKQIDVVIGEQIGKARAENNISVEALAQHLKLPEHMIKQYEDGVLAITALVLWKIAKLTNKPIGFFYDMIVDVRQVSISTH